MASYCESYHLFIVCHLSDACFTVVEQASDRCGTSVRQLTNRKEEKTIVLKAQHSCVRIKYVNR